MPILHAPILEQAGFVKSLIQPVINYVARLNGTDQYWQLSETITLDGDNFKMCVSAELKPSIIEIIAGNSSNTSGSIFFDGSKLFIRDTESVVISTEQDVPIKQGVSKICVLRVDGVFSVTVDETEYTMSRSGIVSGGLVIDRLGRYSTNSFIYSGIMLDLEIEIGGVLTHEIPLTNKAQGATQLPTVGNISATMIGYTGDEWEEVKKLWYNKTTGLVDCSYGLIECNEELITCL